MYHEGTAASHAINELDKGQASAEHPISEEGILHRRCLISREFLSLWDHGTTLLTLSGYSCICASQQAWGLR